LDIDERNEIEVLGKNDRFEEERMRRKAIAYLSVE
jgi:hypothetical protein